MKNKKITLVIMLFILCYIGFHYMTLMTFPYVHSDESWLSGLSRTVLDKGTFNTSEPFFDIYPRAIHGLRLVFVALQSLFITVFGYSIITMRSLSLLASIAVLGMLYYYFYRQGLSSKMSFLVMAVIALMPQFIMMSHFARQEALILLGMLMAFIWVQKKPSTGRTLATASFIGICIGIHPNSFLIGCGIGLIYLYQTMLKARPIRDLMLFIATLGLWAIGFIGISLYINPHFIEDYLAFGSQLGVLNYSMGRFEGFYYYYYKLWHQIGGTYHLLNLKFDLSMIFLAIVTGLYCIAKSESKKKYKGLIASLLMFIGINIGLIIIGRYNQTAIIFPLIWGCLIVIEYLLSISLKKEWLLAILCMLCLVHSAYLYDELKNTSHQDYDTFASSVTAKIPEHAKVLANLNLDYHLELYQLYDIRNLDYLDEHNMSISQYILNHDIRYIVLYDEMQYIADADGKWSILYGNLDYYNDLMTYLENHGQLIDRIEGPTYAMRIAKYVDVYPWEAKVYQLDQP